MDISDKQNYVDLSTTDEHYNDSIKGNKIMKP